MVVSCKAAISETYQVSGLECLACLISPYVYLLYYTIVMILVNWSHGFDFELTLLSMCYWKGNTYQATFDYPKL